MMIWGGRRQKVKVKSMSTCWRKRPACAPKLHVQQAQARSHKMQTCASFSLGQGMPQPPVKYGHKRDACAISVLGGLVPILFRTSCKLARVTGRGCLCHISRHLRTFAFCLLTFAFSACEESFQPVQENERYFFSINGVLDASVDTQWVRVMPVRESLNLAPELPVPEVILQHVESGESVMMRDSVFQYSGGRYAYNFWTTMPIEPEQTYHLTVKGADGRVSSTEATLPKDFPLPQFSTHEFGQDILLVPGVEKLADVQVIYRIKINRSGIVFETAFPFLQNSTYIPPSQYRVAIDPDAPQAIIRETYCGITVIERNVFVASGGPDWPDFVSLDRHSIALPDGVSNVENGVGFLGGIISKTFPYINAEGESGLFEVLCP